MKNTSRCLFSAATGTWAWSWRDPLQARSNMATTKSLFIWAPGEAGPGIYPTGSVSYHGSL